MRQVFIKMIQFYRCYVSPVIGNRCRFYPSCSSYAMDVILYYGTIKGIYMMFCRILRCNPWSPGGIDYPPCRRHLSEGV